MMKKVIIKVKEIPPYKDIGRSIRNKKHRDHHLFEKLRTAAKKAMQGQRWHDGPIEMAVHYRRCKGKRRSIDYEGGIMDTLGGSHGPTFTYMPIVYQDDCQVCSLKWSEEEFDTDEYEIVIGFLPSER